MMNYKHNSKLVKEQVVLAKNYMQFSKKIALIGIIGSFVLAFVALFTIVVFGVDETYLKSITEIIDIFTSLGTASVLGYMGNSGWEKFVRGKYNYEPPYENENG